MERAKVYGELQQYTNVVSDYTKALSIRETYGALLARTWAFYRLKAYDDMIKDAKLAIEWDKKDSYRYFVLGFSYYWKDELGSAISNFDKAIKITDNDAQYYYWRGTAHYEKGNDAILFSGSEYKKAIEDFGMTIKLAPDDVDNYIMRARVYMAQKDYARAVQDFDIAKSKDASSFANFSAEYQQCKDQL
jgi:tetratricopeptide (TPR) repeat protein